jgi:hypothetical protein
MGLEMDKKTTTRISLENCGTRLLWKWKSQVMSSLYWRTATSCRFGVIMWPQNVGRPSSAHTGVTTSAGVSLSVALMWPTSSRINSELCFRITGADMELIGPLITTAWRVPRSRMEETAFAYGRYVWIYRTKSLTADKRWSSRLDFGRVLITLYR